MKRLLMLLVLCIQSSSFGQYRCQPNTVENSRDWADVVFIGQPVWTDVPDGAVENPRVVLTFQVSEYWKDGSLLQFWKGKKDGVKIYASLGEIGAVIAEGFKRNEKYLVYARKYPAKTWLDQGGQKIPGQAPAVLPSPEDKILRIGVCTRTNLLSQASGDLKVLGPSKVPK